MAMQEHHAQWVVIGTFGSVLDADFARQQLDAEGIPVLVKSDASGLFGAGFGGLLTGGITLLVPSPEVARASELLDGHP
jgi:hypothetical protein